MNAVPEISLRATRHEDDARSSAGEPRGNVEAAQVGKTDIEQDEIGIEFPCQPKRGLAVSRLADDLETVQFEEAPNGGPERRVIVDDEDGQGHVQIVTHR